MKLSELVKAPDFELVDTTAKLVKLSEFSQKGPVVLVLARGFM